ncbi:8170_t:CDS:1, partial [Cetraspora pellucida]
DDKDEYFNEQIVIEIDKIINKVMSTIINVSKKSKSYKSFALLIEIFLQLEDDITMLYQKAEYNKNFFVKK